MSLRKENVPGSLGRVHSVYWGMGGREGEKTALISSLNPIAWEIWASQPITWADISSAKTFSSRPVEQGQFLVVLFAIRLHSNKVIFRGSVASKDGVIHDMEVLYISGLEGREWWQVDPSGHIYSLSKYNNFTLRITDPG